MTEPFWTNWAWWAYLFVWVPFALSAVLYATRSPWRRSPMGRALMTLLGSLTAVLSFVMVVLAVPVDPRIIDTLRGLTLGSVGIAGWLLLRQMLTEQKRAREEPCPRRRATDVP